VSLKRFLFCNMFLAVLTRDIRSELRVCEEQEAVMNPLCCDSGRSTWAQISPTRSSLCVRRTHHRDREEEPILGLGVF
jgi:hypothetical protein